MTEKNLPNIYSLLYFSFWEKKQCHYCQTFFTWTDYQTENYQLYFTELIKNKANCLTVQVKLVHKKCCLICEFTPRVEFGN